MGNSSHWGWRRGEPGPKGLRFLLHHVFRFPKKGPSHSGHSEGSAGISGRLRRADHAAGVRACGSRPECEPFVKVAVGAGAGWHQKEPRLTCHFWGLPWARQHQELALEQCLCLCAGCVTVFITQGPAWSAVSGTRGINTVLCCKYALSPPTCAHSSLHRGGPGSAPPLLCMF